MWLSHIRHGKSKATDTKKRPSDATESSGYSSVSSSASLDMTHLQGLNEERGGASLHDDSTGARKHSNELKPVYEIKNYHTAESQDIYEAAEEPYANRTDNTPAFDAFGETKRRGIKSYNIEKRFLQVCRFLLYLVIFGAVLGGGVFTKLSFLSLVSKYTQSTGKERTRYAIYYLLLICIYPCFTMVSSLFKVLFGRVQSLSKRFIHFLMFIELVHTVGLLLFVFKVLPNITGIAMLYVMMCAPVIPSLISLINVAVFSKGKYRNKIVKLMCYGFIFAIQIGSIVSFYFLNIVKPVGNVAEETYWTAPLSIAMVSIGWWDNFVDTKSLKFGKRFTFEKFKHDIRKTREKANVWTTFTRLFVIGIFIMLTLYSSSPYLDIHRTELFPNTSMKTVLTSSLLNDVSSFHVNCSTNQKTVKQNDNKTFDICNSSEILVSKLYNMSNHSTVDMTQNKTSKKTGWFLRFVSDIKDFVFEHSLLLLIIVLTFCVSYCATLACKLHMQRIGFSLATILITPLTFVYVFLKCGDQMEFDVIEIDAKYMCPMWNLTSSYHIAIAVLLWISVCMLTYYVWFPDLERMAKHERMFIAQLKDCIFVDFNLLLRRRKDNEVFHDSMETTGKVVPKVYICATMWHENWKEMVQLLKSLLRIDRHCAVSRAAEKKFHVAIEDPDKFEPEIHIIFDDAFCKCEESEQYVPNTYVQQFMDCLDEAATELLGSELMSEWDSTPVKATLPYGGRLIWRLPGKTKMIVHLKNKSMIRHRKRWSQVMYLYYLLGFKTFEYKSKDEVLSGRNVKADVYPIPKAFKHVLPDKKSTELQNTFILTLDGDVDFKPKAVLLLIDRMKKNSKVGAVCGRIHPIGSGPVVWYQKFEYAIGHWLQKAAEHVLGCVLCCPGCFSLFRASALIDDNVIKTYTRKPTKALHYIQFEQGEDRWLCTLLLQQGYKVDYCAGADAFTFAPETFNEFFIQRRRWSPSTNANIFDVLKSWNHTVRQNANISRLFMAYQGLMLATSLLAPATVIMMITGSYSAVLNFSTWNSYMLSIAPIIFFITVCIKCKQDTQLFFAGVLSSVYTIVMIIVTIGTLLNVTSEQVISPNVLFLIGLAIIFSVSALWHPKEFGCLLHGLLYYVAVPSTFIFLTIYYICNLNVVTWGTRENKQPGAQTTPSKKKNSKGISAFVKGVSKKILKKEQKESKHRENVSKEDVLETVQVEKSKADIIRNEKQPGDIKHWMEMKAFSKCKIDTESQNESNFWNKIIEKYLLPIEGNKSHEEKIRTDLLSLRNSVVFAFFLINFMFSVALLQLQINREKLLQFYIAGKYEPVSVIFLSLFSFLLVLQFLSMLIHRWGTFQHLISSTRVFSCRKLTDQEKFEIHFREAKEHIEQSDPVYDSDKDIEDKLQSEKDMRAEGTNDEEMNVIPNEASLYERQFTRNFDRTRRLKAKRRSGLEDVDWNVARLPKPTGHRKEYIERLYKNYKHDMC